jgi:hypothetical protein
MYSIFVLSDTFHSIELVPNLQDIRPEDLLRLKEKLVETLSSAPQPEAIVEESGTIQFGWTQM